MKWRQSFTAAARQPGFWLREEFMLPIIPCSCQIKPTSEFNRSRHVFQNGFWEKLTHLQEILKCFDQTSSTAHTDSMHYVLQCILMWLYMVSAVLLTLFYRHPSDSGRRVVSPHKHPENCSRIRLRELWFVFIKLEDLLCLLTRHLFKAVSCIKLNISLKHQLDQYRQEQLYVSVNLHWVSHVIICVYITRIFP